MQQTHTYYASAVLALPYTKVVSHQCKHWQFGGMLLSKMAEIQRLQNFSTFKQEMQSKIR